MQISRASARCWLCRLWGLKEIRKVERAIAKQAAAKYASAYMARVAEAEAGIKVLYDEHAHINIALKNTAVGYKCPACAVEITAENIEAVRENLQRRLSGLVNDGKTAKDAALAAA